MHLFTSAGLLARNMTLCVTKYMRRNCCSTMEAAMKVASEKLNDSGTNKETDLKRKPETETDKKVEPPKKKGLGMGDGSKRLILQSDESEDEMVEFPFPSNLLFSNPGREGLKPGSLFITNSDIIKNEEEDNNFSLRLEKPLMYTTMVIWC